MRSSVIGVMTTMLVACGMFGTADSDPLPNEDKQKAEENALPPVGGQPLEGIFVSSTKGTDTGTGSMKSPVKTLARAFALGKERQARVLACAEEFVENVTLVDGVSAFGYFDCTPMPWVQGTARARVIAPSSPTAKAQGITLSTRIEGFEIVGPDLDATTATDDAGTSIALDVRESKGLVVSQSLVRAGKGANGTDGIPGALNSRTSASDGAPANDQERQTCNLMLVNWCANIAVVGPQGGVTTCSIEPSGGAGGKGGDGRWYAGTQAASVSAEFRGLPIAATVATALGGVNEADGGQGKGGPGTRGANGSEGEDGTNGVSRVTVFGFMRGNGTAGTAGQPGQGGGGGAGTSYYFTENGLPGSPTNPFPAYHLTATGGGGGGGGCGGQAGTPGTGGGASIGALVVRSVVTFERTRIESAKGGRGGKGNLGTAGIVGGSGGAGTTHGVPTTGKGGDGGSGGTGGASGHGAPGPSLAIAYTERPTFTDVELVAGPAGDEQPALSQTVGGAIGTKLLPAARGESKAEYIIKQ
jgi:hypothetical protein